MDYYDARGVVHIKCGGKPLEGPYLPPSSYIDGLAQYLARKYGDKEREAQQERDAG